MKNIFQLCGNFSRIIIIWGNKFYYYSIYYYFLYKKNGQWNGKKSVFPAIFCILWASFKNFRQLFIYIFILCVIINKYLNGQF
ncbi:hypothetical protein BMW23_0218 [Bodo saltans virus]|uniref:Transmembrane protein n=1 Tax=Bodo saltans virus TaxID=2024608 RepID=A0A2H4UTU6_9VIRU|nr:hypothetical protein QJ851_gp0213 [Bodo saltans virus]ATZ80276.1 hypothetical protein BMW23_0218 [Bodo saltans virus]